VQASEKRLPLRNVTAFDDHPLAASILAGGFAPEPVADDERPTIRELIRRGTLVERDGIVFHSATIDAAAGVAADLLGADPDGFTVAQFRDRTGASRKFALPRVAELDARGITRRRDDVRIAGPRLPP
jgi:selenocysteine-specific elongation factor